MPSVKSYYNAPWYLRNTYLQTMYAGRFRKVHLPLPYQRERIETSDGDFLDLDWLNNDNKRIVIIAHGMGGNAERTHVKGLAKAMFDIGYDVLAINFRGSTSETNRLFRTYHSGETGDLRFVIQKVIDSKKYESINLSGYSMGGNVILKYLGEENERLSPLIRRAAVMSVPCDLVGCEVEMNTLKNKLYLWNFNIGLRQMLYPKAEGFPDKITRKQINKASNFTDFANIYVAPAFGFKDADDYHDKASSISYLDKITIPTLLLQAKDDTILSESCFPHAIAEEHPYLTLEVSKHGGHVGFVRLNKDGYSWAELRLRAFIDGKV